MNEVYKILERLGATASRNEKESILRENIDNEDLKKVLEYTYNPYKVYGIGSKTFKATDTKNEISGIIELLDYLLAHNTGSDIDKDKVNAFIKANEQDALWISRIILKDLKIGVTDTMANKVWPNLVPTFEVMLAQPFDRLPKKVAIEPKIDGCRCVAIKQNKSVNLFTRNGKKIEGFEDIEKELLTIPFETFVFDGEIVGSDYKDTMNKLFAKDGKKQATYMIFDWLTLEDFKRGRSICTYTQRQDDIGKLLALADQVCPDFVCLEFVQPIAIIENPTIEGLLGFMNNAVKEGYEGIMVKDVNAVYECKRSYSWQKMKPFESDEFRIVGFEEGEGRLAGRLGKVLVDVSETIVGVGSGFTDEERDTIWANQKDYLGRLIEVQYQEKIKKTGSLRFPTMKGFRFDKE